MSVCGSLVCMAQFSGQPEASAPEDTKVDQRCLSAMWRHSLSFSRSTLNIFESACRLILSQLLDRNKNWFCYVLFISVFATCPLTAIGLHEARPIHTGGYQSVELGPAMKRNTAEERSQRAMALKDHKKAKSDRNHKPRESTTSTTHHPWRINSGGPGVGCGSRSGRAGAIQVLNMCEDGDEVWSNCERCN